jgi:hypothetical protein
LERKLLNSEEIRDRQSSPEGTAGAATTTFILNPLITHYRGRIAEMGAPVKAGLCRNVQYCARSRNLRLVENAAHDERFSWDDLLMGMELLDIGPLR